MTEDMDRPLTEDLGSGSAQQEATASNEDLDDAPVNEEQTTGTPSVMNAVQETEPQMLPLTGGCAGGPVEGEPEADTSLQQIAALERRLSDAREVGNSLSRLVANMHAAAVGGIKPPSRGIVEDVQDLRQAFLAGQTEIQELRSQLQSARAQLQLIPRDVQHRYVVSPDAGQPHANAPIKK